MIQFEIFKFLKLYNLVFKNLKSYAYIFSENFLKFLNLKTKKVKRLSELAGSNNLEVRPSEQNPIHEGPKLLILHKFDVIIDCLYRFSQSDH